MLALIRLNVVLTVMSLSCGFWVRWSRSSPLVYSGLLGLSLILDYKCQLAIKVLDYKCQLANTVIGFIWYFFFLPTNHCMHCFVNQPTHSSGNSVLLLPALHYRLLLPFLFVSKLIDYLSLFFCCVRIIDLCVSKLIDYYYKYLLTIYIIKRLIFPLP